MFILEENEMNLTFARVLKVLQWASVRSFLKHIYLKNNSVQLYFILG